MHLSTWIMGEESKKKVEDFNENRNNKNLSRNRPCYKKPAYTTGGEGWNIPILYRPPKKDLYGQRQLSNRGRKESLTPGHPCPRGKILFFMLKNFVFIEKIKDFNEQNWFLGV